MCRSTKIIYNNKYLTTFKDLENFNSTPSSASENILTNLNSMLTSEMLLFQGGLYKIPRRYSFMDMLETQACLEYLDILEALKFGHHIINARKLLHKYLYSQYDLLSCNLLSDSKKLHPIEFLHPTDIIGYNTISLCFDDLKDNPTPAKSIRTYLNSYLARYANHFKHIQCGSYSPLKSSISENQNIEINDFSNNRFYLSAYQIPEFLLLFTFFDGRNFEHCISQINTHKLPPYKETRRFSEFSYQLVLKKVHEYITGSDNTCPLTISTIFRCDNIFLFNKLNFLLYYYDLYLSDDFLDTIIYNYRLSYRQVTDLKETITNNIFKDANFITAGLKSNCLDFMLPFDILYQYEIFCPNPYTLSQNNPKFEKTLSNVKKRVMDIWAARFYCQPALSFLENGDFSITSNENRLINFLIQNRFYKYSCKNENIFLKDPALVIGNNLLSFEIIKKYLNSLIN